MTGDHLVPDRLCQARHRNGAKPFLGFRRGGGETKRTIDHGDLCGDKLVVCHDDQPPQGSAEAEIPDTRQLPQILVGFVRTRDHP